MLSFVLCKYSSEPNSDYGLPDAKRKNYAFYEGYSRLFYEMPGRPAVGLSSGTGVMFRISDNIEVYTANMADTFNMFGEPFLAWGSIDSSRIIFRANDTLIDSMNANGIWVKGWNREDGEKVWYCGMAAVRLPIQVGVCKPIRQVFGFTGDDAGKGDPKGTLAGGVEKSVFKMYALQLNPDNTVDTLFNTGEPGVFLHGQRRIVDVDTNYFKGSGIVYRFNVVGDDTSGRRYMWNRIPQETVRRSGIHRRRRDGWSFKYW